VSIPAPPSPPSSSTSFAARAAAPPPSAPSAPKPAGGKPGDLWDAVKRNLEGKKKVVLVGLLSSLKGRREADDLVIEGTEALVSMVRDPDKLSLLEKAVEEVAGAGLRIRFASEGEKKNADPVAPPPVPESRRLEQRAFEDPGVQEYLREFDGNIIELKPAPAREIAPPGAAAPAPGPDGEETTTDDDGESEDA
jgi:hypothetical protein